MFSVNGVALDNPARGWVLRAPSKPISELSFSRPSLSQVARDGVVAGLPSSQLPPTPVFVVRTPRAGLEALLALWGDSGVITPTGTPTRSVEYETMAITHTGFGPAESVLDVSVRVRLPGAFWRDTTPQTSPQVSLASASVTVSNLFSGLSAPIGDALIRVRGVATGLRIEDAGGSWLTYAGAISSGTWLLIDTDGGRATYGAADSWSFDDFLPDVSWLLDFGGPRSAFELSPRFTDPSTRSARITVSTATRDASALVQVRGRGAYLV